jgi:hypothetical protein
MKYQKELSALQDYIANFNPERFTSSAEVVQSLTRTPEQIVRANKLRESLKRKRQRSDTFQLLIDQEFESTDPEMVITQDDVDALLEGWSQSHH